MDFNYKEDFENSIIVFDTNVWLDMYEYKEFEDIISIIELFKDKVYIPEQVYYEFNKNKKRIIEEGYKGKTKISNLKKSMINELKKYKAILPNFEKIKNVIEENLDKEIQEVNLKNEDKKKKITNDVEILSPKIEEYYDNKKTFSLEDIISIFEEGERRYKYKIPPGFKDKDKKTEKFEDFKIKFGDLLIWKESLRKAKEDDKNLIFVQNEKKDDWWVNHQDKKTHHLLIREFEEYNPNNKFTMVSFEDFVLKLHKLDKFKNDIFNKFEVFINRKNELLDYFKENKEEITMKIIIKLNNDFAYDLYEYFNKEDSYYKLIINSRHKNVVKFEINDFEDIKYDEEEEIYFLEIEGELEMIFITCFEVNEYFTDDDQFYLDCSIRLKIFFNNSLGKYFEDSEDIDIEQLEIDRIEINEIELYEQEETNFDDFL